MNSRPLPYQGSALPLSYASLITQPNNPIANAGVRARHAVQKTPEARNKDRDTFPAPSSRRHSPRSLRSGKARLPSVRCLQDLNPQSPATFQNYTFNRRIPVKILQIQQHCETCGAQGRIRTSVTQRVADLQSAAINHSATCAHPAKVAETQHSPSLSSPSLRMRPTSSQARREFLP